MLAEVHCLHHNYVTASLDSFQSVYSNSATSLFAAFLCHHSALREYAVSLQNCKGTNALVIELWGNVLSFTILTKGCLFNGKSCGSYSDLKD